MLNKWHKISAKPSFGSLTHVSLKTCEMLFIYLTASISIFICLLCWVRWKSPQTKSALGYYDILQRIINCTAGRNMTSYYRTDQFSWDHYMEKPSKEIKTCGLVTAAVLCAFLSSIIIIKEIVGGFHAAWRECTIYCVWTVWIQAWTTQTNNHVRFTEIKQASKTHNLIYDLWWLLFGYKSCYALRLTLGIMWTTVQCVVYGSSL